MSIKRNLILIYLVYFSRASVYLLLLPLLIRNLGEGWGIMASVLSFIQLSTTIMEFGFGVSATKSVARNQKSMDFLHQIVSSVVCIQLMLFVVIGFIGLPLIFYPVIQQADYYFYTLLIILFQGLTPLWFLRGVEDMLLISVSEVVSKFIVLILVYFFVQDASDIGYVYLSYLLGALIPVSLSYRYIYKKYLSSGKSLLTVGTIIDLVKEGGVFFGVRVSSMFVSVGGSLMLGAAGHLKLAGVFAVAERILSGIRRVLMPAWDILFPKLISLLASDENEAKRFRKKVTHAMIGFSVLLSVALFFLAPLFVQYFSGGRDEDIILIVRIMCVGPIFVSVTNSFGLNYLVSHDRDGAFLFSFISGFLFYLLSVGYLINSETELPGLHLFAYSFDAALGVTMMLVVFMVLKRREKR